MRNHPHVCSVLVQVSSESSSVSAFLWVAGKNPTCAYDTHTCESANLYVIDVPTLVEVLNVFCHQEYSYWVRPSLAGTLFTPCINTGRSESTT
jgi:hypothetical protein